MAIFKGFSQNPKSSFIAQKISFLSHLVLGVYIGNYVHCENLCRNHIYTKYVKKGYCKLLVLIYMLFVNLFVRNRECGRSTQVGVEPIMKDKTKLTTPVDVSENIKRPFFSIDFSAPC